MTSRGQETRRQPARNWIEETYGAIRSGEVQHHHSSGAAALLISLTDDLVRHGDSTRPSSGYRGQYFPPERFTSLAAMFGQTPDDQQTSLKGRKP